MVLEKRKKALCKKVVQEGACVDCGLGSENNSLEPLGRFWCLSPVSAGDSSNPDEEDGEESSIHEDQCLPWSDPSRALRYISNSVVSNDASSSARHSKRDLKRLMQRRWAAKELDVSPSSRCDLPPLPGKIGRVLQRSRTPVLEPLTFVLESFDANEWITVLRRRRRSKFRPPAWRGSAKFLPGMESRLPLRRSINSSDLASVSGQKAHDRMLPGPRFGFRRRPSPRRSINSLDLASVSGQKAHDRMLPGPQLGFRWRPPPEFCIRHASSISDDFGLSDFQKCRPAGHKAQKKKAVGAVKKQGHKGVDAIAWVRKDTCLRPITITLGLPAAVSRSTLTSFISTSVGKMAGRAPPGQRAAGGGGPRRQPPLPRVFDGRGDPASHGGGQSSQGF
jgi:hypothetical protein